MAALRSPNTCSGTSLCAPAPGGTVRLGVDALVFIVNSARREATSASSTPAGHGAFSRNEIRCRLTVH